MLAPDVAADAPTDDGLDLHEYVQRQLAAAAKDPEHLEMRRRQREVIDAQIAESEDEGLDADEHNARLVERAHHAGGEQSVTARWFKVDGRPTRYHRQINAVRAIVRPLTRTREVRRVRRVQRTSGSRGDPSPDPDPPLGGGA